MPPFVSVVITTFNHQNFISKTLESILSQNVNFDFEIIIGDDFSTDNTRYILNEFMNKYPEIIRLQLWNSNVGANLNWLTIMSQANGKYIANCDGDDFWTNQNKLKIQIEYLQDHPDCGLVWTDFITVDEQSVTLKNQDIKRPTQFDFLSIIKSKPFLAPSSWLFRSNFKVHLLDHHYTTNCDGTFAFALDIASHSKISYIPLITTAYRVHNKSQTNYLNLYSKFKFSKGLHDIQMYYCNKYHTSFDIAKTLKCKHYKSGLPYSLILNDENFLNEAIINFNKYNISIDFFTNFLIILRNNTIMIKFLKFIYSNAGIHKIGSIIKSTLIRLH